MIRRLLSDAGQNQKDSHVRQNEFLEVPCNLRMDMAAGIPKIVVVGPSYVDITAKSDSIPAAGQTSISSSLFFSVNGQGPVQAIQAALCGCEVYLVSKIGGDPSGATAKETLAEYKVKTDFICTAAAKNTGSYVTIIDAAGKNASLIYAGANAALLPQDIDAAEEIISSADICLIGGHLPQDAVIAALRCAKLGNTKVILNPARPPGDRRSGPWRENELPFEYFSADIMILNLYEAADITEHSSAGVRDAKLIGSDLVSRGVGSVVITMGRRGCMVVDRAGADQIAAFEVELVNRAGIGSAFAGAFAAYCAVESDVRAAVKFASAAAALTCMKFGTIEALPGKADIIELLQKEEI